MKFHFQYSNNIFWNMKSVNEDFQFPFKHIYIFKINKYYRLQLNVR